MTGHESMLDSRIPKVIDESLDWFFARDLKDAYDKRRATMSKANKKAVTAIDYFLKTYCSPDACYPPNSADQWKHYYSCLPKPYYPQIFFNYLKLDISNYLSTKEGLHKLRTKDKVELASLDQATVKMQNIPFACDFPNSIIHLSTGLWAVDNAQTDLIVSSLSFPSVNIGLYFEQPKPLVNIMIDSLIMDHKPHLAAFMRKVHYGGFIDEDYDTIHAFLLISSSQLGEALKYQRLFAERKNYPDILHKFFELCSEWKVTKQLNCLNLSVIEESTLNHFLELESLPVTPSNSQPKFHHSTMSQSTPQSSSKSKPRNRSMSHIQRNISFDSPARNTRSARKKKTVK